MHPESKLGFYVTNISPKEPPPWKFQALTKSPTKL